MLSDMFSHHRGKVGRLSAMYTGSPMRGVNRWNFLFRLAETMRRNGSSRECRASENLPTCTGSNCPGPDIFRRLSRFFRGHVYMMTPAFIVLPAIQKRDIDAAEGFTQGSEVRAVTAVSTVKQLFGTCFQQKATPQCFVFGQASPE